MKNIFEEIKRLNSTTSTTPERGLCKFFEEAGELAQSVNKIIGVKKHKQTTKEIQIEIAEESADAIQNIFSVADTCGVSYDEIYEMLKRKNKKWEEKIKKKNDE